MSITKKIFFAIVLFTMVSPLTVLVSYAATDKGLAILAIDQAKEGMASSYLEVLEAERAGANVLDLLGRLNGANALLVQAQMSLKGMDFEEVVRLAGLCDEICREVDAQANDLRILAVRQEEWASKLTIALSVSLMVLTAFGSLYSWRIFKRYYYHRILGMKPEVLSSEA